MKSKHSLFAVISRLVLMTAMSVAAAPVRAQHEFYKNEGIGGIIRLIKRADCGVRVLMVAAHPDDEDSALIAYLSRGRGARVTYLSLTRGEGGQNSIGPEQGADLGLLRTAELLAARRIDGADQLFGRMIDFGFSKSPEECFDKWGKDQVIADIMSAIASVKPHIVIARFQGTSADGHGQHQASAIAAREAFERSQAQGIWRPQKFYSGSFNDAPNVTLRIDTSLYDPVAGRSCAAVGYQGRSQHRSQDMGMLETEEPGRLSNLILEKTPPGSPSYETDIFDGLDLSAEKRPAVITVLDTPGALSDPVFLADPLMEMHQAWSRLLQEQAKPGLEKSNEMVMSRSINEFTPAVAMALGLRIEAFADRPFAAPGGEVGVQCKAYAADGVVLQDAWWRIEGMTPDAPLEAQGMAATFSVGLSRPQEFGPGDTATSSLNPVPVPSLVATFGGRYKKFEVSQRVPVEYRHANPIGGEVRQDFVILPRVTATFQNSRILRNPVRGDADSVRFQVTYRNNSASALRGRVFLRSGASSRPGFPIAPIKIELEAGQSKSVEHVIAEPEESSPCGAWFEEGGAGEADQAETAFQVLGLDYSHIRPLRIIRREEATIRTVNVTVPAGLHVAYIPGPQDEVAPALKQLGVDVAILTPAEAVAADLSQYSSVVLGARAYEAHPGLGMNNEHFLDYARAGGTLVVQYNKYLFAERNLAPYPVTFNVPHDRVTDENAPVTLLKPEHPAFRFPNEITDKDFEGWVQERGLYFWSSWADEYTPLLSCADAGEPQQSGGLLVAPLGKGRYVYTGLAFFRQIPAGVEGATRLFVNLLSLGLGPGA